MPSVSTFRTNVLDSRSMWITITAFFSQTYPNARSRKGLPVIWPCTAVMVSTFMANLANAIFVIYLLLNFYTGKTKSVSFGQKLTVRGTGRRFNYHRNVILASTVSNRLLWRRSGTYLLKFHSINYRLALSNWYSFTKLAISAKTNIERRHKLYICFKTQQHGIFCTHSFVAVYNTIVNLVCNSIFSHFFISYLVFLYTC